MTRLRRTIVATILVFVVALPALAAAAQDQQAMPKVFITGQIRAAGGYKFEEGLTVGQLIAIAGGLTPYGTTSSITIFRRVDNAKEPQKLDATVTTVLHEGDVVTVGRRS